MCRVPAERDIGANRIDPAVRHRRTEPAARHVRAGGAVLRHRRAAAECYCDANRQ